MSKDEQLQTISGSIDERSRTQKVRHTLQPPTNPHAKTTRLTQSHNYGRKPRVQVQVNPIIEVEDDIEEEEEGVVNETVRNSIMKRRDSYTSQNSHSSKTSSKKTPRKNSSILKNGYENGGFNGYIPNESNGIKSNGVIHSNGSVQDVETGYSNSTRSSAFGSIRSLQVQREQYCCCSKWSPCERKLAASVAVLASIIVVLVVVVGILADNKGVDAKFQWAL